MINYETDKLNSYPMHSTCTCSTDQNIFPQTSVIYISCLKTFLKWAYHYPPHHPRYVQYASNRVRQPTDSLILCAWLYSYHYLPKLNQTRLPESSHHAFRIVRVPASSMRKLDWSSLSATLTLLWIFVNREMWRDCTRRPGPGRSKVRKTTYFVYNVMTCNCAFKTMLEMSFKTMLEMRSNLSWAK